MQHFIVKRSGKDSGDIYLRLSGRAEPFSGDAGESYWRADLGQITRGSGAAGASGASGAAAYGDYSDILDTFIAVLEHASSQGLPGDEGGAGAGDCAKLRRLGADQSLVKIAHKATPGDFRRHIEITVTDQCRNTKGRVIREDVYVVVGCEILASTARAAGICGEASAEPEAKPVSRAEVEELREELRQELREELRQIRAMLAEFRKENDDGHVLIERAVVSTFDKCKLAAKYAAGKTRNDFEAGIVAMAAAGVPARLVCEGGFVWRAGIGKRVKLSGMHIEQCIVLVRSDAECLYGTLDWSKAPQ